MQTVIQVLCKGTNSLRNAIASDDKTDKIKEYGLKLEHYKRQHREQGWAKLTSTENEPGAINFAWDAASQTLTCRVITKKGNSPDQIVGRFVRYLIARHKRRIVTMLVFWPK